MFFSATTKHKMKTITVIGVYAIKIRLADKTKGSPFL